MKSKIVIQCSLFLFSVELQAQALWPVYPQNQPHSIAGTIGEYREYSRFHHGVDILNGANHNVYAIESGTIDALIHTGTTISQINIKGMQGTTKYVHVDPCSTCILGDSVQTGQLIGTMCDPAAYHVHLESSLYPNMLAHRLCGYNDNTAPQIQSVSFRKDGLTLTNNTAAFLIASPYAAGQGALVYNKVDIMARVSDMMGGYTCAPSRLSYEIFNQNNISIDNGAVCNLNFEQSLLNAAASYCFANGTSFSPAIYNYILTAHPRTTPYNRYWNTNLRQGVLENWSGNPNLDARAVEECRYPDGQYNIQIIARDVDYDNSFNQVITNNPVVIDNFLPRVAKVEIRKESAAGQLVYMGQWSWTAGQLSFSSTTGTTAYNPSKIWIKITTSESMADIWLHSGSFQGMSITPEAGSLGRDWVFTITAGNLSNGTNQLTIKGHDLAGNELEGFINTSSVSSPSIPIHRPDGSWVPAAAGNPDVIHAFNVLFQTAPVAAFVPMEVTVNPGDQVFFTDMSSGGPTQWDWSFDGGDPAFSSLSDPVVTYDYPGDFVVVFHVLNQTGVSVVNGIVHVTQSVIAPVAAFSPEDLNITPGTMVDFADLSSGNPTAWYWEFGGAAPSSILQSPEVLFDTEGDYTISLTAGNSAGTSQAYGTVHVSFSYQPVEVMCTAAPFMAVTGTPVYFSGTLLGGSPPYEFIVDPGDGSLQFLSGSSPNFGISQVFNQNGDYTMTVIAIDASGNTGSCCEYVTIFGANPCASLYADFTLAGGQVAAAVNTACTFLDQTTGGTPPYLYAWHFYPDPQTNSQPSCSYSFSMLPPPVIYSQAGNYPVSLHVYDNMGCTHTITKDLQVFVPQHCLVARINIGNNQYHKIRKGNSCFWDFSYSLADFNCSDPPGSGNLPCETDAEWRLEKISGGTSLAYKHTHPNDPLTCMVNSVNDLLFNYNFNQEGWYRLKLRVWDASCGVQQGYVCEDAASMLLDVVDCEKQVSVCNNVLVPGNHADVNAAGIEIGGSGCGVLYLAGSAIEYHAFDQIHLSGEVKIIEGAEFLADIQECPPLMPCSKEAPVIPEQPDAEREFAVYPVPSTGIVLIESKVPGDEFDAEAVDMYGRVVKGDCHSELQKIVLNLENFPRGVYFVRIFKAREFLIRRIVLI